MKMETDHGKIAKATNKEQEISIVRSLFTEYANSLDFELDFQDFQRELRRLPGKYAPPDGAILLCLDGNKNIGCVALRKLAPGICEMKRLYVKPSFRGKGIGRDLSIAIIREAKKMGYEKMRLDTVETMKGAIALYKNLGFKDIPPYCFNPLEGAVFLELDLK